MNRAWVVVVAAMLSVAACAPQRPAAAPPPAPPATPEPLPRREHSPRHGPEVVTACLVQNGVMTGREVHYDPATGDSTIDGRQFLEVYPVTAEHAAGAPWYVNNEPITFRGHRYVKYGLPRLLGRGEVVPLGTYQGVTVFAEPGLEDARVFEVLFLPVTPDCKFQSYQMGETGGAVRG